MDCHDILNQVCEDLSEDINSQVCQDIRAHLETCEDCKAQLSAMKTAVNLYKCLEEKQVPVHVHERLFKMLNVDQA